MEGYGRRVLVADEDEWVCRTVAAVLEEVGYAVHLASDGCQAVAEMTKRRFDVAMADYSLPYLDGTRFLLVCRELWPDTPVILLSAELPDLPESIERQGVFALVSKPFETVRLLQVVHDACTPA